jgi:hypothetical protein
MYRSDDKCKIYLISYQQNTIILFLKYNFTLNLKCKIINKH